MVELVKPTLQLTEFRCSNPGKDHVPGYFLAAFFRRGERESLSKQPDARVLNIERDKNPRHELRGRVDYRF